MSQIEVIVLRIDGSYEAKRIKNSCKALGAEVQGYVEVLLNRKPNYTAYVNEEGALKRMPRNLWTDFLRQQGFAVAAPILGPVVLCRTDKKGADCDVGESLKLAVRTHQQQHFKEVAREAPPDVPDCVQAQASGSSSSEDTDDSDSEYDGDDEEGISSDEDEDDDDV